MTSGGITINIICGMKYTTEMICGGGAEHNDYRSKLKREIGEKKKEVILRVLMEKGRKRPPAAFQLGVFGQSASSIQGNLGIQGKRESGEKTRSR